MRDEPDDDVTTSRVRVAYFVPPSPDFAGVERVVHEIATGLAENYDEILDVHVIFSTRYEDELLKDPSYTLHVLDIDRLRELAPALRSFVSTQQFDIFVSAQVEPSVVAWTATRLARPALFVTHLHGNPQIEEHDGSLSTRAAFTMFRHVISRNVDGIIAVSPSLRRYTAESVTQHAPVLFAKNPARLLGGDENRRPNDGTGFTFLNIGRLSPQKGQDILLRAAALARPDLPPRTRIVIVGTGPSEADLRSLSHKLDLDDLVHFAGYTANPADYFRNADCFVLSSRWEGFPLVLLEALRFGLPLLAATCDFGPADLITDPRIGDLVPPQDVAALAEGLTRATTRPVDVADEEFRRSVADGYRRDEATRTHLEALQEIALRKPALRSRLISVARS